MVFPLSGAIAFPLAGVQEQFWFFRGDREHAPRCFGSKRLVPGWPHKGVQAAVVRLSLDPPESRGFLTGAMVPATAAAARGTTSLNTRANARSKWPFGLGALILVALLSRLSYFYLLGDFIGADEAVVSLMGLNIVKGQEFPLLLCEAHYAGTLTSYLGALLFWFFNPTPWTLRMAVLPLALGGIAAIAAAARTLWGLGAGLVAGISLAVGPALLFAMSSQAVGGYPEGLCFGGLTLWIGARLGRRPSREAAPSWE